LSLSKAEILLKLERFKETLQCIDCFESDEEEADEKLCFIRLTCYLGMEDYEIANELAEQLKLSENDYYVYFATYADAFSTKKLAEKDASKKELAESKYTNAIAYYRNQTFENPQDLFAVVFRVRLYAENGKFAKADELIKLLPDELQAELKKYADDCRAEFKKG